jgi:hypothetical protein
MSHRYLSLWLPYFATDRLGRIAEPLATLVEQAGVPRIVAANQAAAALGIAPGMALADARALPIPCGRCAASPGWPIGVSCIRRCWRWMAPMA